ncbi:hypothetical protein A2U01_0102893 [Trifolium medium]|uniref:Uncharacterized protein n=1 Tax=Trifolium medium TaxID=97028 RepID=A0A392V315_9FABA|nr:hypothetical protein [Trifolium medium]
MSQISARPEKIHQVLCINQMSRRSRGPSHHLKQSAVVDDAHGSLDSRCPAHGTGAPAVS